MIKSLYIFSTLYFIFALGCYFFEGEFGFYIIPIDILIFFCFIILLIFLFAQCYKAITERLKNKTRLKLIGYMSTVTLLLFLFYSGYLEDLFRKEPMFIAQREGAANCMTTLNLYEDRTFSEESICFGRSKCYGNYYVRRDTIFFTNIGYSSRRENDFYEFATIGAADTIFHIKDDVLIRYQNSKDSSGNWLFIVKNELK